mmetsp:Transcript_12352/g.45727  ORF Transcript_12352/g.45727 Transcript_12352/m.45727 type:complete len:279 (-) Transcript_12352:40-876(-)
MAVDDLDKADDASVFVIPAVDQAGPQRRVRVSAGRRRDLLCDGVQDGFGADVPLGGAGQHFLRIDIVKGRRHLQRHILGRRMRKITLCQDRDDAKVLLLCKTIGRERLGLQSLRGIHQKQRAVAGRKRAADFVGEVDVAGRVDEVEKQRLLRAGMLPDHRDGLCLHGDATLALHLQRIQLLRLLHLLQVAALLQQAVCQGALAVIDVRDDAEVPNPLRRESTHGTASGAVTLQVMNARHITETAPDRHTAPATQATHATHASHALSSLMEKPLPSVCA